ncbi:MAG: diaminopimelate epimerase [Bacteroidetes bacterium]|nr:diaminopimelate epimerase [Bacteroidota bacterium]
MQIPFYKYQGAGNDFVMLDCRDKMWIDRKDQSTIARLCDRRFGIGADGLILLRNHPDFDFEMIYFNADGAEGSMCGNGGRCIVAFAKDLGIIKDRCLFIAVDGPHEAGIRPNGWIDLQMQDVDQIEDLPEYSFLDTGSPHVVQFVEDLDRVQVHEKGKRIREDARFAPGGTNVNFVQPTQNETLRVATFERGVEAETLACGTGVTAVALVNHLRKHSPKGKYTQAIAAKGADLEVRFNYEGATKFSDIWLCGPAEKVFKGVFN